MFKMSHEQTICRLCLKSCDFSLDIFDSKGINGLLVWRIIKELTELEVSRNDGLPKTICEECMKKIAEFKHFKTMCINSGIEFLKAIANRGLVGGDTSLDRCGSLKVFSESTTSDSSFVSDVMDTPGGDRTTPVSVDVKPNVAELRKMVLFSSGGIGGSRNIWVPQSGVNNSLSSHWRDSNQTSVDQSSLHAHSDDSRTSSQVDVLCESGDQSARTNDMFSGDFYKNLKSPASRKWYKRMKNRKSLLKGNLLKKDTVSPVSSNAIKLPEGLQLKRCHVALTDVMRSSVPHSVGSSQRCILTKPSAVVAGIVSVQSDVHSNDLQPKNQGGVPIAGTESPSKAESSDNFEIPLYCDTCMAPFADKPSLTGHIELCHVEMTSFCCKVCFKTYDSKLHLDEHIKVHFRENQQYCCSKCHSYLQSRESLLSHIARLHQGTGIIMCELCKKAYHSAKGYQKHVCRLWRIDYKCLKCGKVMKDLKSYKFHVTHCQMNVPVNVCHYCGNSFMTMINYSIHMRCHGDNDDYWCRKCRSKVGTREDLVNHLKVCEYSPLLLSKRQCSPAKNAPRLPDVVKRIVSENSTLKYKCPRCDKAFATEPSLRVHKNVHSRSAIYPCPLCSIKFKFMRSRYMHVTLKHPDCAPEILLLIEPKSCLAGGQRMQNPPVGNNLVDGPNPGSVTPVNNEARDVTVATNQSLPSVTDQSDPVKRHQCRLCGKRVLNLKSLARHENSHKLMSSFHLVQQQMVGNKCRVSCPKCPARFKFPVNRVNHMKTRHPDHYLSMLAESKVNSGLPESGTDTQCVDYPKGNIVAPVTKAHNPVTAQNFGTDLKKVNSGDPIKKHLCNICRRTFQNMAALVSHKKTHLMQKMLRYRCHFCPLSFMHAMNRMVHIRTFHPGVKDKPLVPVRTLHPLVKDKPSVHVRTLFPGVKGTPKNRVQNSIAKPNIGMGYQCPQCPAVLNMEWALKFHLRNIHSSVVEDNAFFCNICGKCFAKRRNLTLHMVVHSSVMPYSCRFCLKKFRFKCNCKSHMRKMHAAEFAAMGNEAIIQSCEDKVESSTVNESDVGIGVQGTPNKIVEPIKLPNLQKVSVKKAEVVKTPPVSYWCHYCPEIFTSKTVRGQHELSEHPKHAECTRMLKCHVCSKTFKMKKLLYSHLLMHSSFPRYQCDFCDMRFKVPATRRKHMKKVHSRRPR